MWRCGTPRSAPGRAPRPARETWWAAWLDEGPGGWRPFFIQYPSTRAERRANRARVPGWSFHEVGIEVPDPSASAAWLGRVLGVDPADAPGCTIRFAAGPRDRITRVVLYGVEGPIGDFLGITYGRRPR